MCSCLLTWLFHQWAAAPHPPAPWNGNRDSPPALKSAGKSAATGSDCRKRKSHTDFLKLQQHLLSVGLLYPPVVPHFDQPGLLLDPEDHKPSICYWRSSWRSSPGLTHLCVCRTAKPADLHGQAESHQVQVVPAFFMCSQQLESLHSGQLCAGQTIENNVMNIKMWGTVQAWSVQVGSGCWVSVPDFSIKERIQCVQLLGSTWYLLASRIAPGGLAGPTDDRSPQVGFGFWSLPALAPLPDWSPQNKPVNFAVTHLPPPSLHVCVCVCTSCGHQDNRDCCCLYLTSSRSALVSMAAGCGWS